MDSGGSAAHAHAGRGPGPSGHDGHDQAEAAPVWVIGADHWPRALLRAELIERGHHAIGFASLRDAVRRLILDGAHRPALIVIDLQDQPDDDRLMAALFRAAAPIVAIGGAAAWADERLRGRAWALFLRRPVSIGAVAAAVDRLAPPGQARPPAGSSPA
jgi:hypothetical protein